MRARTELLNRYIPENAVSIVDGWISNYGIHLLITRSRSTKHGDYYPPLRNNYHKISINHDLNKYAFLVTFVHEMAHLLVWIKFKNSARPHGKEWKIEFKNLMENFFEAKVFPPDIESALKKYLINAKASTVSDLELSRVLDKYDTNKKKIVLEELAENSAFSLKNGKTFIKGEKLRKCYRCTCLFTKRIYLINPLAEVFPMKLTSN